MLFGFILVLYSIPLLANSSAARIVSLDLCTDWMLVKYSQPYQRITYSPLLYRFRADWVPDNLPTHDGSLEQILLLDPELVVTGEYNALTLRKRLQQVGKNVQILPMPVSLPGIEHYLDRFHELMGTKLMNRSELQGFIPRNRTLLLLGANALGTGIDTLENDILEQAGWTNYLQHPGYITLDLETIIHNPPNAILSTSPGTNSLSSLFAQHEVFNRLPVMYRATEFGHWRWQCPGPWSYELVEELSRW
jgi:iron complex transport system substrate-binding protein